ncbi:MAG: hypothetical protein Q8R29_01715 [bacterium]|nr:hypothetical protein [bacterium]
MTISYKHLVLSILAIAFGFLSFWSWQGVTGFIVEGSLHISNFIWPIISLILAASLFAFSIIFVKTQWLVYLTVLASTASAFFLLEAGATTVWALLATVFLVLLSLHHIKHEVELSRGFSLSKTLKSGLPLYFTAASVIISVFYFDITKNDGEKMVSALFPKPAAGLVVKLLSGQLESLLGFPLKIKADSTVDEVIMQLLRGQLQEQDISLESIPKKELENLLILQRKEIAKKYNIQALSGKEKVSDALYEVIIGQLTSLVGPYKEYIPLVSAFAFFFAFKTFTLPIYYLSLLFSFVLLKLAILGKIIKREKVQIQVERLSL